MSEIDLETWSRPIAGANLKGATLAEEIGDDVAVLIFLRHFG